MTEQVGSKTYVTINGVNVTNHVLGWSAPEVLYQSVEEVNINLSKTVSSLITIVNEQEVVIKRGKTTGQEAFYFRGFLKMWSPKGITIEVVVKNKLHQLERREVTNVYTDDDEQAGVLSAIAEDLMTTHGGFSSATVTDSSSFSRPLNAYPCQYDQVLERVEKIRQVLDWVLRYDYENDLPVLEPKANTVHPFVIRHSSDSTSNVLNSPKWEYDSDDIINRVRVVGRAATDIKTVTANGDGSTTVFALNDTPGETEIFISGVKQVMGVIDQDVTFDYSVNQAKKTITFVTAPPSGTGNITVNYGVSKPPSMTIDDEDSIDTYGLSERTFYFEDVVTQADAEKRAEEIKSRFAQPLKSTMLEVYHTLTPIRVGMSIRVVDDLNNIDEYFIVTEVLHQWPSAYDIVHVGQERVFERTSLLAVEDRLAKLEKREFLNIGIIPIRKDANKEFRLSCYAGILTRDTSVDGAWGKGFGNVTDADNLTWGATGAVWQSTYTNDPAVYSIIWPSDKYEEDFSEDFFVDTDYTTATIDTVNNEVSFA